ncbi:MAG: hypothetical protein V7754_07285 [Halioglobus sp.]
MYRYSVDKAITYTSEDIVLFKESPFACWMERLTLENPQHGIPPDVGSDAPRDSMESQEDLAETLRAEGKDVALIDWDVDEPLRRETTLDAMRSGVDFIVDGQLALGSLSGSANLLMRTSGYSELGSYLYVPCNTQPKTNMHSALRLCFLADLLHSLQGQLPPQMLIIRGGSDVVPLVTEDHIYHYRAVKHRFMSAQQSYRPHKMPDPAESAQFGRWADCANEVMRQRALRNEETPVELGEIETPIAFQQLLVGGGAAAAVCDLNEVSDQPSKSPDPVMLKGGGTLAEQARMLPASELSPGTANSGKVDTLQNLAFIGSSSQAPTIGQDNDRPAPSPSLRKTSDEERPVAIVQDIEDGIDEATARLEKLEKEQAEFVERQREAALLRSTVERVPAEVVVTPELVKKHPLDSVEILPEKESLIDRDGADFTRPKVETPAPALAGLPEFVSDDAYQPLVGSQMYSEEHSEPPVTPPKPTGRMHLDPFSSSLMTSSEAETEDITD